MEIIRSTPDLAKNERTVIDAPLAEGQRVVVQGMDAEANANGQHPRTAADYAILADLDDSESDRLVEAMTQRSPRRDIAL